MQQITTNLGEWGVALTFDNTSQVATVTGIATRHHLIISEDGAPMRGENVHCSVAEQVLIAAGFTTRNANREVILKDWKVSWADATGFVRVYRITETYPDDLLGLIVCILKVIE